MSDSESNKKKVVIVESPLSSSENEDGEEEKQVIIEGGAKKVKEKEKEAAAAAEVEEEKGDKPSSPIKSKSPSPSPSPPQSPSKQKKKKEKKSGNKKLGLDVGELGEEAKPSSSANAESEMSQLLNETIPWNIIDKFFSDNPNILVAHQLDSYNEFISNGISQIFKEHNPIVFQKEKNPQTDAYKYISRFYLGGKNGDKIYYGKPVIYDETGTTSRVHYMYPNEARLRNMTYGVTIHYDVDVEFEQQEQQEQQQAPEVAVSISTKKNIKTVTLPQILLGKFPSWYHDLDCNS